MRLSIILETPEGFSLGDQDPEVQQSVASLFPVWPSALMVGTQPVSGRQLIHAAILLDSPDPLAAVNGMIAAYGLDWTVMGLQSFGMDGIKTEVVTAPIMDQETGKPTGETEELEQAIPWPVVHMLVQSEVLHYLTSRFDPDNHQLTPDYSWLSGYSGQAAWVGV